MYRFALYLCITILLLGCRDASYQKLQGFTMGTSYHIAYAANGVDGEALFQSIEKRLAEINQRMSTYIEDSELMQLNSASSASCFPVSVDTLTVLTEAKRIYDISQGAFDPGLGPLIELWGFDRKDTHDRIPTEHEIAQLKSQLTFGQTQIDHEHHCIHKGSDNLFINLSAIAKGYAVDEIAKLMEQEYGITDYLVEIGGEIKVKGLSSRGTPWSIAIESPITDTRAVQKIINPGIMGVATSGDYRNYFERDGKRYSHTLDPVSGYPISHALASVTVLHPSTMTADALATALMVLGEEKGMKLAEQHHWAVFMIVKTDEGFKEITSSDFKAYLKP
jgi:thiamine biosynthesis lipoprotein